MIFGVNYPWVYFGWGGDDEQSVEGCEYPSTSLPYLTLPYRVRLCKKAPAVALVVGTSGACTGSGFRFPRLWTATGHLKNQTI